jgi:hypothetical protein
VLSRLFAVVSFGVILLITVGCGGASGTCQPVAINVGPLTATANHAAAAPGNSQVFSATEQLGGGSACPAVSGALISSNWTASDPSVQLSASPTNQVTAICTATVANVTITATSAAPAANGSTLTGHASLTCN